jgi:predicted P-loop ATPase
MADKVAHTKQDGKAKIKPIISNKFTEAESYLAERYEFRLNTVSLSVEYRGIGENSFRIVNENTLFRELQKIGNTLPITSLVALLKSDFVEEYDPIGQYFLNLEPWDEKTDYIDELAGYVLTHEFQEWKKHFKKHLVRTVVCATNPKFFNKQALILIQQEQNSGKSTYIRFLCPPILNDYFAEDITSDKDSRILLVKNFIINLDELAKWSKKDVDTIKSYFSKTQINERLPYDRKNSVLTRRASFFGSTNKQDFLTDETGSVRWLCFQVKKIDWNYTQKIDINKVWAQAYHLSKTGFYFDLTVDEISENEKRNKQYFVISIEIEYISKLFDFDPTEDKSNFKTASDVMGKIYQLIEHRLNLNFIQVGKALTFLGCPKGKENGRYGYYLFLKLEFQPINQNNSSDNNENNLPNLPY